MAIAARRPSAARQKASNKYVGEQKNQLRHGYGVYSYENKFFRYEGQWENGRKQGHGKLLLGDGGYYEGSFVQGEIEGHGYRVFGLSGSSYSGQFHRGELHGQGLFRTAGGEQYEGEWMHGKKEGSGILTETDGSVYEGGFHYNRRHGEGVQIYSNGDHYDGDWVSGKRHGHGMLRCANGTIYDGQWRGGVYHGEGSISHASGVTYQGMWLNGRPACESVCLKLPTGISGSSEITVEQGKSFNVSFSCVDAKGEIVEQESGRSFKVTAAVLKSLKPSKTRSRTSLTTPVSPATKEKKKEKETLPSPFGPCLPYDLLQLPQSDDSQPETPAIASRAAKQPNRGDYTHEAGVPGDAGECLSSTSRANLQANAEEGRDRDEKHDLHSSSTIELHSSSLTSTELSIPRSKSHLPPSTQLSGPETKSMNAMHKLPASSSSKDEEFLASLTPPSTAQTTGGRGSFKELYLPPLPPPDVSHILSPSPPKSTLLDPTGRKSKSPKTSPRGSPRISPRVSPSQSKILKEGSTSRMRKSTDRMSKASAEKEKLLQPRREKFCPTGTYILTISEVTEPPFLGTRLPDVHVQVRVVAQKMVKQASLDKLIRTKSRLKN